MSAPNYESPGDFKQALEARLRKASDTGLDFTRRRQLLVFDRFLARVVEVMGEAVIVNIRTFMDGHQPPHRLLPDTLHSRPARA